MSFFTFFVPLLKFLSSNGGDSVDLSYALSAQKTPLHPPPPGTNYATNPTVFGRILEGTIPTSTLAESKYIYAFRDKNERAPLHALVIPKEFIPSIKTFGTTTEMIEHHSHTNNKIEIDGAHSNCGSLKVVQQGQKKLMYLKLVQQMQETALEILKAEQPRALHEKDYLLCFHIPPFTSVDHLHLHVLAPVSTMSFWNRRLKYLPGTCWCTNLEQVLASLENNISQ